MPAASGSASVEDAEVVRSRGSRSRTTPCRVSPRVVSPASAERPVERLAAVEPVRVETCQTTDGVVGPRRVDAGARVDSAIVGASRRRARSRC